MTKAEIQLVRALADKRGRTEHGLFVAEGEKLIGELRASHLRVRKIFALEGVFDGPEQILLDKLVRASKDTGIRDIAIAGGV